MVASEGTVTPAIIADPAEVTGHWLQRVLAANGHDVEIVSISRESVGTGQMAHNERYKLTYAGDAGDAPASVVIKFPSPSEESRAAGAAGGYRNEVRFYTDLAPDLAVVVPDCLYGAVADDSTVFTLVLEDLAPARQGDQIAGAPDEQVLLAVENLAGLHAPRWDDPTLDDIEWLQASGADAIAYIEMITPMFVDRYQARLSDDARTMVETFAANIGNWIEREPAARTLVHGDYRLDNLMFASAYGGAPVSTVDWQTIGVAAGGRDVGYLLGNSAEPEDRRRHEPEALERYRVAMAAAGVELTPDEVMDQYRHGSFQGPFVTMLGSILVGQTDRGDDMFMAMIERAAAQILDLDALDIIT
ncbi:MAG: phosphotransferase [Acidimicrobiales bacterium]|nr:phosphotransferase [Acidimicrobiales bacterium]